MEPELKTKITVRQTPIVPEGNRRMRQEADAVMAELFRGYGAPTEKYWRAAYLIAALRRDKAAAEERARRVEHPPKPTPPRFRPRNVTSLLHNR